MAPKRNNNKKQEKRNSIKKTKRVIRPVEDLYDSEASNSSSFCEIIAIKRTSRDNSTDSIQYIKTIDGETVVPRANCAYNDEVEVLEVPKVSNKRKNSDANFSEDLTVSKHFKYAEFFNEFREYESDVEEEETELVESSEIKESEEKEVQSTEIKEREKEAEEEMVELPEIKEREEEEEAEEKMVEPFELPKLNEFMSSIDSRLEEMTGEIEERNPKVVKFQLVFSDFPVFADDTEEMIFPA